MLSKFKLPPFKLKSMLPTRKIKGENKPTNLTQKLSVNEEYMRAFRSESYTNILAKVHGHLCDQEHPDTNLHEYLLAQQETLISMANGSNLHELILDYFHGSLEAFKSCSHLLDEINQIRKDYMIIQHAIQLGRIAVDEDGERERDSTILRELAGFAGLDNSLSCHSQGHFGLVHPLNHAMSTELNGKDRVRKRRAKLVRFIKRALLFVTGALTITTLVAVGHSIIGIICVPLEACTSFEVPRRRRPAEGLRRGLAAQLDAAAKGAYILDRDFDTMCRLAVRLHDEVEHNKAVVRICTRSQKGSLLKEALKELESGEACFLEQLEELESHVYLCFLTINKTRRLILQEQEV